MNKIKSFQVNHDLLKNGVYVSRIDGDITTFDLRFKIPNNGDYLKTDSMHTIEHLAATYVRNSSYSENIIYFGPMGCRTGFYLLTRNLDNETIAGLIYNTFLFISMYEGEIPGSSKIECGNYLEHDLAGAKKEAEAFLPFCKKISDYPMEQNI